MSAYNLSGEEQKTRLFQRILRMATNERHSSLIWLRMQTSVTRSDFWTFLRRVLLMSNQDAGDLLARFFLRSLAGFEPMNPNSN